MQPEGPCTLRLTSHLEATLHQGSSQRATSTEPDEVWRRRNESDPAQPPETEANSAASMAQSAVPHVLVRDVNLRPAQSSEGRDEDDVPPVVNDVSAGDSDERTPRRRMEQLARKSTIKIASLNINGFGSLVSDHPENKWNNLYRMMNEHRIGVLLLQETHLTERRVADLHDMFAKRIKIFSASHPSAPTQKEGVAVVINKKLVSTEGLLAHTVVPGRALQVSVPCRGGDKRHLLCIYAPSSDGVTERKMFFQQVRRFYDEHPTVPKPDLMAGDFNTIEDSIDRMPMSANYDSSTEDLDDLKSALGLMIADGWRMTFNHRRDYTFYRGSGAAATMSRLDRIYTTPEIFDFARQWEITEPGIRTDHKMVSVELTTPNAPIVGKGRPIFPLHLLKNKPLAKKMKERGMQAMNALAEIEAHGRTDEQNAQTALHSLKHDWMEMAREKERATVPKLIQEAQQMRDGLKKLKASQALDGAAKAAEVNLLTEQLHKLEEKRLRQKQLKGRARHRVEGESPTKYWSGLHRAQVPRELIPAFEREEVRSDGSRRTVFESDASKMAEMARNYHDGVQRDGPEVTSGDQRENDIQTALASLDAKVSPCQAAELGASIDRDDCELALKYSKVGTAPGKDGIQYEVWKTLHERFKEDSRHEARTAFDVLAILAAAFSDVQTYGVCSTVPFAEGWMVPIWKEKGEKTKIENYRPITLLNPDYKLLSKVLAIRLAAVAPDIVHPSQAGFVPGRRLRNQTQLARMMIHWAEAKEINGTIVALDQEKAYDRIAHDYLWRVLHTFGIPPGFTNIVRSLYRDAMTCVTINGVTSNTYKVYRGVRQGDPLSCLLFDLAIEPLSAMIRKSELKGFDISNRLEALKATLFADDTTTYLHEDDDFGVLQNILDTWCSAAKAKFNMKKTEIIPIGQKTYRKEVADTYTATGGWKNYPRAVHVAGEGDAIRILGAFLGNGIDECDVWSRTLAKITEALDRWKAGRKSLEGKRHIAQMLFGGMTQFLTDVQRMPPNISQRLTKILWRYIWDDHHNTPVGMSHLMLPFEKGSFKILDLDSRNEAIDVSWLKAYLTFGPNWPWWADVADGLFAHFVTKDCKVKDSELRINPFLQHWKPKRNALPPVLRSMFDAAKKHGLRVEGLAFERRALACHADLGPLQS
ncbi:hypothetical protein BN946_scf184911.g17 [Trametes cinnabarina]|uniref:Reverse transcriptase domain-containing protein n=1 Tax=Pycnoporus cinnabarinus TaxID=5643 RepID=A0A060SAK4_PYCCI|nr:hypothetical protein BN946_scf184911.g17 [Trametes cinnabarina]